jgi:protein-S-isoprenylcysteine O-methyltransferase Ste14
MITGALLVLSAETLLFQSWPIFIWLVIFAVGNVIYIPTIEEKGLEKRFGRDYLIYKRHVPRWIPRLTAWQGLQKED